jgi:hypothetical protein
VAPAATATEAGTVSEALLLANATVDPPMGAVWVSVTVHVLTALWPRLVGLQATPETRTGTNRLMVAVFELLPRVAVTVALWLLAMLAAAVALKVAVVVPAVIVTDGGTVSKLLLLASVTLEPPMGATWVSVTVQVLTALCARLVGLQVTPETSTGARRPMLAVWKLPPRIAVTVTLWLLAIELAAVALKAAVVAPAATITQAGTVSQVLLLSSATLDPPVGAAWVSVTVQVLTALCARLVGLQVTPETRTPVSRLMVTVRELLPRVAVKVALWLLAIEAPAVALNVAVVAPVATVTDAGTVSEALLLPSVTFDPPVGAVWVSVTVQVMTPLCPRLVGLQATPETSTGANRLMVAVCELVPRVAVMVALWLLAIEAAAVALKVAVVVPAATVTEAGTVSEALLLANTTLDPPVGAVWVSVAVQVLAAFWPRLVGLQATLEISTGANRLMVSVCELLPRVAVTVALWLLAIEAAAVALNVAVVAPAATVTEAGTVSEALLLASVTLDPPVGAVVFKVTVQLATAPGFRLPGLHMRDEMAGTVTIALAPADTVSPLPVASTPTGLFIVIAVVTALAASVNWMLATTPEAIVLVFNPDSRQVNKPDADAQ